jgi:hypothetical protein
MAPIVRLAASFALLAGLGRAAPAADLPLEYAVKASYLYKFAPFVQWPPAAFESPGAPLTICIAGPDPFGPALEETVKGQRVNGHPIAVRHVETVHAGMPCQILFVAGDETEEDLRAIAHDPILTVTDRARGSTGGMIQFVMVGGRVRFAINQAAAQDSGIAISSKLLGLALSVNR